MMQGFVRQRPQSLRKFSSDVLKKPRPRWTLVQSVIPEERLGALVASMTEIKDSAAHYFESASGLEVDLISLDVSASSTSKAEDLFKLMRCAPPLFKGEVREFPQWWEHFEKAVHNNESLS